MSLAWSSIVLLLLLLPGFLFFIGIYFPEHFTRETAQRSVVGQLAAAVLVAFLVHAILYQLIRLTCGWIYPCVDLSLAFQVITLDQGAQDVASFMGRHVQANSLAITGYVLVSSALGLGAGWLVGWLTLAGKLRLLAQHTWIYDLAVDKGQIFTIAYVMTHVRQEERVLVYSGFLRAFSIRPDGRFSYLVLADVARYYVLLKQTSAETSPRKDWHMVGSTGDTAPGYSHRRETSYFVIEGEDIANAMFDRYRLQLDRSKSEATLRRKIADAAKRSESQLAEEEALSVVPGMIVAHAETAPAASRTTSPANQR